MLEETGRLLEYNFLRTCQSTLRNIPILGWVIDDLLFFSAEETSSVRGSSCVGENKSREKLSYANRAYKVLGAPDSDDKKIFYFLLKSRSIP